MAIELIGVIRVARRNPKFQGKQFLGVTLECSDGMTWVIDYREQSRFQDFEGRQVRVAGEPYEPDGQHLIDSNTLGHLRVSTIELCG